MRILFLSRWYPYPANNGSRLRISNLIEQLGREHEVALLSFKEPEQRTIATDQGGLPGLSSIVAVVPHRGYRPRGARARLGLFSSQPRSLFDAHSPELARLVEPTVRERQIDLVIASELDMLPYARQQRLAPRLVEDLEVTTYRDQLEPGRSGAARLRALLTWLKLRAYLRRVLPDFAAVTVVSQREQALLEGLAPAYGRISLIPNAVALSAYVGLSVQPEPRTLVFAGSLRYSANYDAVAYFLDRIYPLILSELPDVKLRITGSTDGVDLAALAGQPGLELTGYVEDIRSLVAASWASIVPLREGSGTRLKILESMALGTPVVSTTKGAEGLDVTDGQDILLADDPAEFARRLVSLLRSRAERDRLAVSGARLVATKYDWESVGTRLRAVVSEAVAEQCPGGDGLPRRQQVEARLP